MSSSDLFSPGDFLLFQIESGYGLLRILRSEDTKEDRIWHVAVYQDLFLDPEAADNALEGPDSLSFELHHVALTNRAFESTQVAKLRNIPLNEIEQQAANEETEISDRSIRLMMGLR